MLGKLALLAGLALLIYTGYQAMLCESCLCCWCRSSLA